MTIEDLEGNPTPNIILNAHFDRQTDIPTLQETIPIVQPRNQHLKKDEPKNQQFTGRATQTEANRINKAIQVRKREGQTYDIVRLLLDCLNHIEQDIFQSFKTK